MHEATITRTLAIDGMTGELCVQRATAALKGVPGVTTKSVTVGEATIESDQKGCDAACAALTGAGFTARWTAPTLATKKAPSGEAPGCPTQQPAVAAAATELASAQAAARPIEVSPIELAAATN